MTEHPNTPLGDCDAWHLNAAATWHYLDRIRWYWYRRGATARRADTARARRLRHHVDVALICWWIGVAIGIIAALIRGRG